MKSFKILLCFSVACPLWAQQPPARPAEEVQNTMVQNLPAQPIGPDDLIAITVYDSPELTRTVRVSADGTIRLPLLKQRINAKNILPANLETEIATELQKEGILVDPVVSVSVAEYRSRPISVSGAVRSPLSFQALPGITLLDAITKAQGLSDEAGTEIIVTRSIVGADGKSTKVNQRIPVKGLLNEGDSTLNMSLVGGEEIRVPEAGRIFVVGNVKVPGAIKVHETNEATVFKAVAMSQGLMPYSANIAYIYRKEGGKAGQDGIPVELSKIMDRKSADVPLQANDILYIPDNKTKRATLGALERVLALGGAATTAAIYTAR